MNPDITSSRHGGNAASQEAHARVQPTVKAMCALIADYICSHHGVTSEDVQTYLRRVSWHRDNFPPNVVSPRISELKRDRIIMGCGLRGGRQVLVKYRAQMSLLEVA